MIALDFPRRVLRQAAVIFASHGGLRSCSPVFLAAVFLASAASAQTYTLLTSFTGPNGRTPELGALVQGLDGNLYGTTQGGGKYDGGTVFLITPQGALTTLHSFCPATPCTDGQYPNARMTAGFDGNLYGTTADFGGTSGSVGTIFKITPAGALTTLYSFCGQSCGDGAEPENLLQASNGDFFGSTFGGGLYGGGTVFQVTPQGVLTTLYSFCGDSPCPDGTGPLGLALAANGEFYGTTDGGPLATTEPPTFYRIASKGVLTTLYRFCQQPACADGLMPEGTIAQADDGNFYETNYAAPNTGGTIVKLTPAGVETTLYSFCGAAICPDGAVPLSGVIAAPDGNLYGNASEGGYMNEHHLCGYYCGVIFEITPQGAYTPLYMFCTETNCPDGSDPQGPLFLATDGNFYGLVNTGGAANMGGVFRLDTGLKPFVRPLTTSGLVGAKVILSGMSLTGSTRVTFNGTNAAFTVVSSGEITTHVPAGATSGPIKVTTPGGVLPSNVSFRVL